MKDISIYLWDIQISHMQSIPQNYINLIFLYSVVNWIVPLPARYRYFNFQDLWIKPSVEMVFSDNQVKIKSLGWAPIQYDCVIKKERNLDVRRHVHSWNIMWTWGQGSGWMNISKSRNVLGKTSEARREVWIDSSSPPSEKINPANTLISDFRLHTVTLYISVV